MDAAAFAVWRIEVGALDRSQRGAVLQDLAFAEANDPIDLREPAAAERRSQVAAEAVPAVGESAANLTPAGDLMAQIGQARVASLGCPHCGSDAVRRWGEANGKPRYRCTSCGKTGFHAQTLENFEATRFRLRAPDFRPVDRPSRPAFPKTMVGRHGLVALDPAVCRDGGSATFPKVGLLGNVGSEAHPLWSKMTPSKFSRV